MAPPTHRRPTRASARAALPDGPFSVASARSAGWTPAALRHAVAAGELERLRPGVLARPVSVTGTPSRTAAARANLRVAQAASLTCSRAAISHLSAGIAHGMPLIGGATRTCLTVRAGSALRGLRAVHLHRATLLSSDVVPLDGYCVTSAARTIFDIAREHGVAAGVVAADCGLHERLVDRSALAAAFEQCAHWPGRKAARITLTSADGAAESPLESLSRLRMRAEGLPSPRLQPDVCDQFGRFLGRVDFYWDEFGVVGEADGNVKYAPGDPAIVEERAREKHLEQTGLIVVRWGWADLTEFAAVAQRLRTNFARGARRGSPERQWGILRPRR